MLGQVNLIGGDYSTQKPMPLLRLYLNHVVELDRLMALEYGRVYDGQPAADWRSVGERFGFLRDGADGPIVGFGVQGFSSFDVDEPAVAQIWSEARFDVPVLGLASASAAEIILAARPLLGDHGTVNRHFFSAAVGVQDEDPEAALSLWFSCLQAGDSMAHFGLGYTLYELGRYRESYRHLRYYAQIAPSAPWNWCCLGRAAEAIGEVSEARSAYRRAIELSDKPGETEARSLLRRLCALASGASNASAAGYFEPVAAEPHGPESAGPLLGERFEQALQFAAAAHRTQLRKGSNVPYVGHLLGVCSLVIEDGGSEDEAIAALLHDAVEDQGGRRMLEDIRRRFGDRVATIVDACSDTLESPKPPWRARKEAYLEHLEHQPQAVLRVSLADKLFNARAILRDYLTVGEDLWIRFKTGREAQLWYYRELSERFDALLPGRMATELSEVVRELEQAVAGR